MKTGLPRHFTVTIWPASILEMSISVEDRARVEASGLICEISGHTTVPTPTAPMAPVAIRSMSRRVTPSEGTPPEEDPCPWFAVAVDNASLPYRSFARGTVNRSRA